MSITVYTVTEAAHVLRVSSKTIYRLIEENSIKCVRIRGSIRITQQAIDDYINQGGSKQHEKPKHYRDLI